MGRCEMCYSSQNKMFLLQVFIVATLSAVVLGQQQQAAPAAQAPQQAPAQPRHLPPAAVHFVNIGEKLEGDYKFGYDTGKGNENGQSFREETRLPDGSVKGAYGFIDASGKMRIIRYTAGKDGFKAEGDIFQDGAPANTPGLNGPAPAAAPAAPAAPSHQQRAAPVPQYLPQTASQPQYQPQPPYQQAPTAPAYRSPTAAPYQVATYQPILQQPQTPSYQTTALVQPQPYQPPVYQQQQQTPQTYQPQSYLPAIPQYQSLQYRPERANTYQPASPTYTPQSIQYRPQPQPQSGYPQYASQISPQYAQPNYAYPASVSGGYRQPQTSNGLYASAQTNRPQKLQPAFPDFFRVSSPTQATQAQSQAQAQAQAYQQPAPQQYRSVVSDAPVSPVQSYSPRPVYRQQAFPSYKHTPHQYQLASKQGSGPVSSYSPAAQINDAGPKKKYEDGQYDPELTKAGLYYPELYEKISTTGKDGTPRSPTAAQIAAAAANAPQSPRPLPYFDPSLLAYNIGTQQTQAARQA
ncbi:DNA-directed RNA polymerase II subunit RPB1-like isoform X1 [Varroa jacobsoni]|uniref:DNA-directed RNA polymerase II subunit RPB1-like isoform X1 n=1 Tax=Varroa jacobsoni TaxID=62625 RepID=UPI000BF4C833|nr:DNA-directed RNA polymerase II subunit RPB1-like isoform X1 [Varroa jacobsoni]